MVEGEGHSLIAIHLAGTSHTLSNALHSLLITLPGQIVLDTLPFFPLDKKRLAPTLSTPFPRYFAADAGLPL
jgi:hypothetical protein